MLSWKPEFETGSPLVDTQHKILFDRINKLGELLNKPTISKIEVDGMLDFLGSYVASHFRFEEQCMEQHKCPAHAQNKQAHEQFINVFKQFKVDYAAKGPTKELLQKLHKTSSDWIQGHIMKIDVQLRPCMKH